MQHAFIALNVGAANDTLLYTVEIVSDYKLPLIALAASALMLHREAEQSMLVLCADDKAAKIQQQRKKHTTDSHSSVNCSLCVRFNCQFTKISRTTAE